MPSRNASIEGFRIYALVDPVPIVCKIVVVAGDYCQVPVTIVEAVKDCRLSHLVRRHHLERVDIIEHVEYRMFYRHSNQVALRKSALEFTFQDAQVVGSIEIVDQHEAPA